MTELEIRTAIAQTADHNAEALRQLFDWLEPKVFAFVCSRVRTREIATDITADIFVELFRGLPTFIFQSLPQFYQYVFVIARRRLAKHYDSRYLAALHERDDIEIDTVPVPTTEAGMEADVRSALDRLDPVSREIVVLHHWSRHTFSEIGTLLHMTESAVRVRHHRAKQELAALLA